MLAYNTRADQSPCGMTNCRAASAEGVVAVAYNSSDEKQEHTLQQCHAVSNRIVAGPACTATEATSVTG